VNGAPPHEPIRALAIATILVGLFAFFIVFPGHDPKPNGLPIAVTDEFLLGSNFDAAGFDVRLVEGGLAEGRELIEDREVYGVISDSGTVVLTAPAASFAASEAIVAAARVRAGGPEPRVQVVKPLDRDDPRNTTINLTTLAVLVPAILVAVLGFQLAPALPGPRRVALIAGFSVIAGLLSMLIVRVLIGALPGSYLALSAVTALAFFALASMSSFFILKLGPPGIALSFILFLMLANPASGAATAPEMLPDPWSWAGQLLPPGAFATGLRNTAYFDAANALQWLAVLGVFGALGVVGILTARGGGPPTGAPPRPAPQG
jgi:hypothetical protein